MNHADHIALIREGMDGVNDAGGGTNWADFGAGEGAFTLALADCLNGEGNIVAVDKSASSLAALRQNMRERFPRIQLTLMAQDVLKIDLPPASLDGVVMANLLHFFRDKSEVLKRTLDWLRPGGRLIVVEYNADQGNVWVPHPFTYTNWEKMAAQQGFIDTRQTGRHPSRFLHEMYSAVSFKKSD